MTTRDLTTPLRRGDLMLVRSYVRAALRTDPDARVPAAMLARVLATLDDLEERRRIVDEMTNPTQGIN